MKSRIVFTTMAMTSILAVSSLCTGCKSADASTKSNIDSSSMAVTSAVDSVADTSSVAEVKKVEREFTATLEVGKTYTPQDVAGLLVAKNGVSIDSSSIDVSSIATSSVTVTESSASDVKTAEVKFATGVAQKSYAKTGEQQMTMTAKYPDGSEELWNITVTVVDSEKPKFTGIKEKYEITEGGKLPDFKKGVSVKDNYDDSVEFTAELDGKAKKSDYKAGKYTITYKAKDSSGNEVTATSKLVIKKKPEEKKKDEKSEETSDNNNNYNNGGDNYSNNNGGNSDNNNWSNGGNGGNGGSSNNNGGNGGSSNNNGGNSNNNGGNSNNGGSSNNNGGGSSNNNGGGSSNNNGGGAGGGDVWDWDDENGHHHGTIADNKTPGGNTYGTGTQMWGDPFGLGYDYPYMVYPNGEIISL